LFRVVLPVAIPAGGVRMKLRCIASLRWLPIGLLTACALWTVQAQQQPKSSQTTPTYNPTYNPNVNPNQTTNVDRMGMPMPESGISVARREAFLKSEQHKRMVESTNRLLLLTQQFQADTHGRELTAADSKRLDEIAKLAHTVRQQMLGH
jgi:hypothetical protein